MKKIIAIVVVFFLYGLNFAVPLDKSTTPICEPSETPIKTKYSVVLGQKAEYDSLKNSDAAVGQECSGFAEIWLRVL